MSSAKKIQTIFAGAMLMAILGLAACNGSSGVVTPMSPRGTSGQAFAQFLLSPSPPPPTAPPVPTPTPILLSYGQVVGTKTFAVGDTSAGGNGQSVDGIGCGAVSLKFHLHAHVSIWHNGRQIAFPIALGIPGAILTNNGTRTNAGRCFYNLHSHDMSGIVHVEAPQQTIFTLGQVFDIWGEPLSIGNIAGFVGPTLVYVDTNEHPPHATIYNGDPRAIILTNREQITLEVGGPFVYPIFYRWPY